MWNNYATLLVIAALLRADYEIHSTPEEINLPQGTRQPNEDPLALRQKRWADKAVEKYAEAQEKKWRNWRESMFEKG